MKRLLLYIIVAAAAVAVPVDRTDVGKLQPVELIQLYQEGGQLVLETDTGDAGRGRTVAEALEDLKATTPGTIFLDTADYLMISEGARGFLGEVAPYLKERIRVCIGEKGIDLPAAAAHLAAHSPKSTLKEALAGAQLETLTIVQNRLILR